MTIARRRLKIKGIVKGQNMVGVTSSKGNSSFFQVQTIDWTFETISDVTGNLLLFVAFLFSFTMI